MCFLRGFYFSGLCVTQDLTAGIWSGYRRSLRLVSGKLAGSNATSNSAILGSKRRAKNRQLSVVGPGIVFSGGAKTRNASAISKQSLESRVGERRMALFSPCQCENSNRIFGVAKQT